MITKVVNSYDLHINGQALRVVEKNELRVSAGHFEVKDLLLNEPRGSKYMNLLIFHEDKGSKRLEITLDSVTGIENADVLIKSFISSLVDRKRIEKQNQYTVDFNDEIKTIAHSDLEETILYDVSTHNDLYEVNGKMLKLAETSLNLEVQNIVAIKDEVRKQNDDTYDYLILYSDGTHATANRNNDILPYPIIEVISLLNKELKFEKMITLNGDEIKIQNDRFKYEYQLISNSQFYIDDTDIYSEGFIIK